MSNALYALLNPVVKSLLRSRLHGLMSSNTMLLEFRGRKTGNTYVTPVSYHETDGRLHCFTDRESKWWRNLQSGDEVTLTLRGTRRIGKPTVLDDGSDRVAEALRDFLIASPRDASHSGVALDDDGRPRPSDVAEASKRLVFVSIELMDPA